MFVPCLNGEHTFDNLDNGDDQCRWCGLYIRAGETPRKAELRTFAEQEARSARFPARAGTSDGL